MISALIELLGSTWQAGDLAQFEAVARSLLRTIPDDTVAMQFLGLALYRRGHETAALRLFRRAAAAPPAERDVADPRGSPIEPARVVAYREATRPGSGLAGGWLEIAEVLARLDFIDRAAAARQAARRAGRPG